MVGRQPRGSCASGRVTVSRGAPYAAAAATPLVRFDDPAGQDRTIRLEALADDFEAKLLDAGESGQVRAGEAHSRSSVGQVEVFWMDGVGTPIIGRPRPLPGHRRAVPRYTLICEGPDMALRLWIISHSAINFQLPTIL